MTGHRFLLYCHDAVGLGHTRRTLTIANELVRRDPQASVLVAAGCESLELFQIAPRVDILRLPGIRKGPDGQYEARRLELARQEMVALRGALLSAAVEAFRPSTMLADKHPAGAGGELANAALRHKSRGGRLALGFRDVLDDPMAVRAEWARTGARQSMAIYDEILVYGDPRIVDHHAAYGIRPFVEPPLRYCGYVTDNERPVRQTGSRAGGAAPRVLASAGGGEDGVRLMETMLAATASSGWETHIVLGPMAAGTDRTRIETQARQQGAVVHDQVPELASQFASFDALVTMAGYNTLVEAVCSRTPTICVPRVVPRTEQLIRAKAFAKFGLVDTVHPDELTPNFLKARIQRALDTSVSAAGNRARPKLDLRGAHRAADALIALAGNWTLAATGTAGARQ